MPPRGGLGLDLAVLYSCSLLAGHVGNILGGTGLGFSLKNAWLFAFSADILLAGLYVRNLKVLFEILQSTLI